MFAVLGMTGCRAGEMLGLKIGDLDFNRKVIYIRRSIDSRTKQAQSTNTKNSTGEVSMPAALEKRLRTFLRIGYRVSSVNLERAMGIEQIQSAKTKALLPASRFNWSQMESGHLERIA